MSTEANENANGTVEAPGPQYYLISGAYLPTGSYLTSQNRQYYALMGSDGRFGSYEGTGPQDPHPRFVCQVPSTSSPTARYFAIMQRDGNFVIYAGDGPSQQGSYIWGLDRVTKMPLPLGDKYRLELTENGNLRAFDGNNPDIDVGPYWSAIEPPVERDTYAPTVAGVYPVQTPAGGERKTLQVRRRFQPRRTRYLSQFDLSIVSPTDQPVEAKLNVYKGEYSSTQLVSSQTIVVAAFPKDELKTHHRIQNYTLPVPYRIREGQVYTFEIAVPGGAPLVPCLYMGSQDVLTPESSRDEVISFAEYIQQE